MLSKGALESYCGRIDWPSTPAARALTARAVARHLGKVLDKQTWANTFLLAGGIADPEFDEAYQLDRDRFSRVSTEELKKLVKAELGVAA